MTGPEDHDRVRALLGRAPLGSFDVVVRDPDGAPVVIRNAPLLDDGTPMPTRFWLIGPDEVRRVGRLEAAGGVRAAEADVDPAELADAHRRYAAERDAVVPPDHAGPAPSGGVGGTREGVKCLHAHYAWHLAGGDDPVGRWVAGRLEAEARTVRLRLDRDVVDVRCGSGWRDTLPAGPDLLLDQGLCRRDPPAPEDLTNALGTVDDEVVELLRRHPELRDRPTVHLTGELARVIAQVEVGSADVPDRLTVDRLELEDLFRTLATERAVDRAHNPGLPAGEVDRVLAACCVAVGTARRLHLDRIELDVGDPPDFADPRAGQDG